MRTCQYSLFIAAVYYTAFCSAQETATVYLTAKNTDDRISLLGTSNFSELPQPNEHTPLVVLDATKTFQEIEGFGGALTDASAETFYQLSKENQDRILTAYFDKMEGIGYTLCRTHIHSCDFSSESYTYIEEGDAELNTFNIEHDQQFKLPLIKEAFKRADNLKLLASPWSPPGWMKSTNRMVRGGKLLTEFYQPWANYYVRFIAAYAAEGIPIWGLSVQNEALAKVRWESCEYTAQEERDFVKNHLGPTLSSSNYRDTKLVVWDHNRGQLYQRASVIYSDKEASKYVWGTGFHWYSGDHFDNVKLHAEAFPDKKLLFTEGTTYPFDSTKVGEWHWGERYGESIIKDLNNGVVGWIDWNILLNEKGGPNHVSNFCYAPIIANTRTDELQFMSSYYYLGHFSKFIRPGAKRIICSTSHDDLLATAFINEDDQIVAVIMNQSDEAIDFKLWINEKAISQNSPEHSVISILIN